MPSSLIWKKKVDGEVKQQREQSILMFMFAQERTSARIEGRFKHFCDPREHTMNYFTSNHLFVCNHALSFQHPAPASYRIIIMIQIRSGFHATAIAGHHSETPIIYEMVDVSDLTLLIKQSTLSNIERLWMVADFSSCGGGHGCEFFNYILWYLLSGVLSRHFQRYSTRVFGVYCALRPCVSATNLTRDPNRRMSVRKTFNIPKKV